MSIKYWAIPTWNGQHWDVCVEDYDDRHHGDTQADRLAWVRGNAAAILAFDLGCLPEHVTVGVEIRLPDDAEQFLRAAEIDVSRAAVQLTAAVYALRAHGMTGHDIDTIITGRLLQPIPDPPLTITHQELGAGGLSRRPDVVAVERQDGNRFTIICRTCVDDDRDAWRTDPDASAITIYTGPITCDGCGRSIAMSE